MRSFCGLASTVRAWPAFRSMFAPLSTKPTKRLAFRTPRTIRAWPADSGLGARASQALPFVNPVSTAFCLQALALWEDRRNSSFEARRQPLI